MSKSTGFLRNFTAVDLVTIAVFAVIFRVAGIPIYRFTEFFFPYNIGIRFMIDCILAGTAVVIVGKRGTLTIYAVTWWLINFVFEGEDLAWIIGMWIPIIATELYLSYGVNYKLTRKSAVIGIGILWGSLFAAIYWIYLQYFYLLIYPIEVIATSFAITVVLSIVGGLTGLSIGDRLKGLVG